MNAAWPLKSTCKDFNFSVTCLKTRAGAARAGIPAGPDIHGLLRFSPEPQLRAGPGAARAEAAQPGARGNVQNRHLLPLPR